ncbi:NADPH-dependent F420 reductase [Georgenia thermotolerans]|uniref:NADP oxidoreductase n=1 Tax=Georgenia thermotolerans TaxID=527326 RepID=A0A7J5ULI2_9MICO|nr:NADPH-dependent F420 reductase [Georgenia thermotolerans]KAE8763140.1 NADP oxidoreductase [Georgenia thermotolerans]
MKISIIGTGNMGRAIATRAAAGHHEIQIVDRDRGHAEALAQELGGNATAAQLGETLTGDVVVLALYYQPVMSVIKDYGPELEDKVVVDITNPVDTETFDGLVTPPTSSAAEEIQKKLPGSRVVKAFNTTLAGPLTAGEVDGHLLDVFVAADDEDAKAAVTDLVESAGLRALDAGPLRRAHELEALGFLQMTMQAGLGNTWSTAIKVLGTS